MKDIIYREDAIRLAKQGQIQGFEWQFKKLCELPSAQPEWRIGEWIEKPNISECDYELHTMGMISEGW